MLNKCNINTNVVVFFFSPPASLANSQDFSSCLWQRNTYFTKHENDCAAANIASVVVCLTPRQKKKKKNKLNKPTHADTRRHIQTHTVKIPAPKKCYFLQTVKNQLMEGVIISPVSSPPPQKKRFIWFSVKISFILSCFKLLLVISSQFVKQSSLFMWQVKITNYKNHTDCFTWKISLWKLLINTWDFLRFFSLA